MCLPREENMDQIEARCEAVYGFLKPGTSSGNVVLVLLVSFIILCCVVTVVFYNYRFCKDNEAPFQVPDWCPTFLFPRSYLISREVTTPGEPLTKEKEMKQQINPVGYYLYGDDT